MPMSDFSKNILCKKCGELMGIDLAAQHSRTKDTNANWPMESDALGVHPDQAREYSDYLRKKGVPTEVNPETGNPVLTSRFHRKRLCEATQMYDRNAGYGDQAPRTEKRKQLGRRRRA